MAINCVSTACGCTFTSSTITVTQAGGVVNMEVGTTPGWSVLPMNTPWTATNPYGFAPPSYRKVGDIVYLRGTTTSNSVGTSTSTIAVLPLGCRPPLGLIFPAWMSWAGTTGRMAVRIEIDAFGQIGINHIYSMPTATGVPVIFGNATDHLSFDGMFFSTTT
jgi:hypothetical protein